MKLEKWQIWKEGKDWILSEKFKAKDGFLSEMSWVKMWKEVNDAIIREKKVNYEKRNEMVKEINHGIFTSGDT